MGWKDIFIKKEEEVEPPRKSKDKPSPLNPYGYTNQATVPGVSAPLQPSGVGNVDYNAHFDKVMQAANLPGPDYHEFSIALQQLAAIPLTEDQKYKTANATFQAMGVTGHKLAESAQQYLGVLDKERKEFLAQLDQTRKVEVTDKAVKIQAEQAAIEQANQSIQKAQANIQKMTTEKMQAEQSLAIEENNFHNTYNQRIAVIQDQMSKIKTYLDVK